MTWPDDQRTLATTSKPPQDAVRVVYRDDHLAVLEKPAGLAVHAGQGRDTGTLVDALLLQFPQLAHLDPPDRPGVVHRLDMDTSGLMVIALTEAATKSLSDAIRKRQVVRKYLALVDGVPERQAAIIDAPVGRDPTNPMRQAVDPYGRHARTRFAVVQTYTRDNRALSLLQLKLESGRMHQIRVHLNAIGHPVIGDQTYRGRNTGMGLARQFLHAHRLEFKHPYTREQMQFDSDLPEDLATFLGGLQPTAH